MSCFRREYFRHACAYIIKEVEKKIEQKIYSFPSLIISHLILTVFISGDNFVDEYSNDIKIL